MTDNTAGPHGPGYIRVRGARTHNLKGIDLDLPRDRLVVLTGVSGSGKSSLAFDTLYAEGQRRYLESLSTYARQYLDQRERPDVDLIDGLPPTVALDQRSGSSNPRSTVATVAEVHEYLRLLYARAGTPHCPACGAAIRRQTPEQMVATVLELQEGRKVLVLAPLARGRKGRNADAFQAVRRAGLLRARVDGAVVEVGKDDPPLSRTRAHTIEAVVDRLVVRAGIRPRLAESLDLALKLGDGTVVLSAEAAGAWEDVPLSLHFACPVCGLGVAEIEPRTFSFNSPQGACPTCQGLGTLPRFDPELIVPDPRRSLEAGAVAPWEGRDRTSESPAWLGPFLQRHGLGPVCPLQDWPAAVLSEFLLGGPGTPGVIPGLEREREEARSERRRAALDAYRSPVVCPDCDGARLRPEARGVTLAGRSLPAVCELPVSAARAFFEDLAPAVADSKVSAPLVREVATRLGFLERVGLGYLTLARGADTLSGGELQRARLASQLGTALVGVCYVLDEPTAGLHPRDTAMLLASLTDLRDLGNSLIVVEHDEATIRAADWVVDVGPGAGPDGGEVVALGPPAALVELGPSATARFLRGEDAFPRPPAGRLAASRGWVVVEGASERNLRNIDMRFPVRGLTCISGVSGSGKSTLVHEVLDREARRALEGRGPTPGRHRKVTGLEAFDKRIVIDQSPIGRGPRSTPATFAGVFDEVRKVFAKTREAKLRGYGPPRFSFNVKGGRCERCRGQGVRKVAMSFLPDFVVTCEACRGLRFNRQTLEVRFKGRSIGEVLGLRVDAALALFGAQPKVARGLAALHDAGLGYVTLGQSGDTLSGGEAQRVKLASELARPATGRTLYILDEPTSGLHFRDVARLIALLHGLVNQGNTVVVIEHHLDVLRSADWLIDLGPGGGEQGGRLLAEGPPALVAESPASVTGPYLRPI